MPAIVEADDNQLYVLKFRGAGQGPKALIAELLAGEIARALGLPVPEIVLMMLDPNLGNTEPDPEIQDLIKFSAGVNLGMAYLPSALMFGIPGTPAPDATLASQIVWFDAYVTNVDRTPRNPNLLWWREGLWLIDHGATLYFHHAWLKHLEKSRQPFPLIKDHVLLRYATALADADARLAARLTDETLRAIVALLPDDWLSRDTPFASAEHVRRAYFDFLRARLAAPRAFVTEARDAQSHHV